MATEFGENGTPFNDYIPPATRLRGLLASSSDPLILPGVYDGLTARIALSAGHQALYMTGAGTSASVLGQPDLALITATEMVSNARTIASLDPTVPLVADADTGFGGPLNVARTVKAYIEAGIAGLHLEDQVLAKRCGHLGSKQLVSREEFFVRIRAAVRARKETGRDLVLIARTDALQGLGMEEALERLKGAVAEGADVVFLEGIKTEEEGRRICKGMAPTPCLLNVVAGGVTPIFGQEAAASMGFKLVIWPCAALTEVFVGVKRAMEELKKTGRIEPRQDGQGGVRDIFKVCGLNDCMEFDGAVGGVAYGGGV